MKMMKSLIQVCTSSINIFPQDDIIEPQGVKLFGYSETSDNRHSERGQPGKMLGPKCPELPLYCECAC